MTLGLFDPAFLAVAGAVAGGGYDPDAQAYITAVEAADGQALETGVKDAINAFVVGCKADGIWSAIKASCILAGARTLNGALVPLVGPAPTNFNFVAGDYDRKTGLVGNGSTKYLNSNRAGNADPQNNNHNSVYISTANSLGTGRILSNGGAETGVNSLIVTNGSSANAVRNRSSAARSVTGNVTVSGLYGVTRSSSANITVRVNSTSTAYAQSSESPRSENMTLFAGGSAFYSDARIAFYSIGEALDLALLDARVTTLINALGAAIP